MTKILHPADPWQAERVFVAVETVELRGETIPLSYSHLMPTPFGEVDLGFFTFAWTRHLRSSTAGPTLDEFAGALKGANSNRVLTPVDFEAGELPRDAYEMFAMAWKLFASSNFLVVTHAAPAGLPDIIRAAELNLAVELPAARSVNTAVLQRGRLAGLAPAPGEPSGKFYARAAVAGDELPDLMSCYTQHLEGEVDVPTTDRFFPVLATAALYDLHAPAGLGRTDGRERPGGERNPPRRKK